MSTGVRTERAVGVFALVAAVVLFVAAIGSAARRGAGYDLLPLSVAGRLVAAGETGHVYAQDPQFYNLTADSVFRQTSRDAGTAAERKSIWLDPGAYNLEVRAPGKRTYTRRIYVLSGKALRVNARLEAN